jgi:hypothetical protein
LGKNDLDALFNPQDYLNHISALVDQAIQSPHS